MTSVGYNFLVDAHMALTPLSTCVHHRLTTSQALSQKWRVMRPKAFKLQKKGAMDYTLHDICVNLYPSKLCFTHPKNRWTDGWLRACHLPLHVDVISGWPLSLPYPDRFEILWLIMRYFLCFIWPGIGLQWKGQWKGGMLASLGEHWCACYDKHCIHSRPSNHVYGVAKEVAI